MENSRQTVSQVGTDENFQLELISNCRRTIHGTMCRLSHLSRETVVHARMSPVVLHESGSYPVASLPNLVDDCSRCQRAAEKSTVTRSNQRVCACTLGWIRSRRSPLHGQKRWVPMSSRWFCCRDVMTCSSCPPPSKSRDRGPRLVTSQRRCRRRPKS